MPAVAPSLRTPIMPLPWSSSPPLPSPPPPPPPSPPPPSPPPLRVRSLDGTHETTRSRRPKLPPIRTTTVVLFRARAPRQLRARLFFSSSFASSFYAPLCVGCCSIVALKFTLAADEARACERSPLWSCHNFAGSSMKNSQTHAVLRRQDN